MRVWSLATQLLDDCQIDVRLYLTDWQAYEGLAGVMFPDQEDAPPETHNRRNVLLAELHKSGVTSDVVDMFDEELDAIGLIARVEEHSHPWVFGEEDTVSLTRQEAELSRNALRSALAHGAVNPDTQVQRRALIAKLEPPTQATVTEHGRLAIVTEDGENILIDREKAPKVYKAWELWVLAEERSSEEAHRWNEVLEAATEYLHDAGFTDDTAEDVIRAEELDGNDTEQEGARC